METLGNRLKALREKRGLSIGELSQAAGVAATTYREWEYGRAIRGEPYVRLASVLGVSVYELLTGEASDNARAVDLVNELEALLKKLKKELASAA